MRDAVANQGSGFVDYLWPQPGKDEPVAKLAYAEGFASGAGFASGLYLDDLNAAFRHDALMFVKARSPCSRCCWAGWHFAIKWALTHPVHEADAHHGQGQQQRDLTCRAGIPDSHDELGAVGRAFNQLLTHIQQTLSGYGAAASGWPAGRLLCLTMPTGWPALQPNRTRQ